MTAQKLPPVADLDAEASVLGALLYDARHVSALPAALKPETFYSEAHRQIFTAVCELRDDHVDVNVITVTTRLRAKGALPKLVDGAAYLAVLVDGTAVLTDTTFASMAKIVTDRATQRSTQLLLARAAASIGDPALRDVPAALAEIERELLNISLQVYDGGGLRPVQEAMRAEVSEWGERNMGRGTPGVPTGFRDLDADTGGLHGGDLIIVGARPGMGKSSYVASVAVNVAKRGEACAIFSLEMPARQLAARILCTQAGLMLSRTRSGALTPRELTAAHVALSELAHLGLYIDDAQRGRPYVADIVARSRRLAAELARKGKRLACIVVDYIQIVKLREVLVRQRQDLALGEVSIELKSLAKELNTTVIACAQLNRGVDSRPDKRPAMSDLRECGQFEQDADLIAMLYRDEYYNPATSDPGVVEVILAKNRHGRTGTVRLRFDGPTTKLENLEADREAAE